MVENTAGCSVGQANKVVNRYALGYSPVNVIKLKEVLSKYPVISMRSFLYQGFKFGFSLHYSGPRQYRLCKNLRSAIDNMPIVAMKLNKEIKAGRVAGPFDTPPFSSLQVSPLGLVPKKDGDWRLIHHLSYPEEKSINDFIDKSLCSVQYSTIDDAANMIQALGKGTQLSSSDIKSAFRLLPIAPCDFELLGMTFEGKLYYDKMVPFGSSISCSLFNKFSTFLKWATQESSGNENILHYLDDFLFMEPASTPSPGKTLKQFQTTCKELGVPLSEEKTVAPTTNLIFLGVEFDTQDMVMKLPEKKLMELRSKIHEVMNKKKVSLVELQSLLGLLNFACRVIAPGRAFCRRLINATIGVKKSHFKIRVSRAMKSDLETWVSFLNFYNGVTVILEDKWISDHDMELYTDSAGGKGGFGIYFGGEWAHGTWPLSWVESGVTRDLTFLELFPVVAALLTWEAQFRNKKLLFHIDNQAVIQILNTKTSKSERVMNLVREMVLMNLNNNTHIKAVWVPSKLNRKADFISRSQWGHFRKEAPEANWWPTKINPSIWDICKL